MRSVRMVVCILLRNGEIVMKTFVATSVALLTVSFAVAAAAELESGLQVGDSAGPYNVKDCTGPNAGKSLCYR